MSEVEDKIINNMKFSQIFKDNIINNPWLLNYEKGFADIPESEGGGKGTVYTASYDNIVVPTIMENEEGNLQHYKDKDEAFNRGYGIQFSSKKEANEFSEWLHGLHEMSGENEQSYDL